MKYIQELTTESKIAYFSMEIGFRNDIPTYSGGLGVLAGDTIKSAADLNLPMVAVTLLYSKGYFRQELDSKGRQIEHPEIWNPAENMSLLPQKIRLSIEGREVAVQAWVYNISSLVTKWNVPIFFLDTDLPENSPEDREITSALYGGDERFRLKQEIVLGIGGVMMLRALGIRVKKYHMNEGHASLLTLELLLRHKRDIESVWDEREIWDVEKVKDLCVFTTHTPVEAGHDKFSYDLVKEVMGEIIPLDILKELGGSGKLNMTLLAMNLSQYINGVAKKHGEVSKVLFPGYKIQAITNGVHSFTWTCESFAKLYDKYLPGWANEPELFVRIDKVPGIEIWEAHLEAKKTLIDHVNSVTNAKMDYDTLTIGFARRATAYKRANLLLSDPERLKKIGKGKLQIIYAGKAHPRDNDGKKNIEEIFRSAAEINGDVKIVYLENYNMELGARMVSGVDVWLNTPMRPREASGTSGMKAAHNGVINFSVLDGWWIEGHIEGYTGWAIGPNPTESTLTRSTDELDAEDLYDKLENLVIPTFYDNREIWIKMMQNAIGKNAYYFNSHRMMRRYVTEAYIR
ncbi:MAG: alpha-glucan family phosphorylase [Deltaproteobacteria bacterium]|nr:alpha-glucan family phosphorylase [Deltaproteobacteria bacterium]